MTTETSDDLPSKYKQILAHVIPNDDYCKISSVSINIPHDLVKAPMASDYEMVTVTFKKERMVPLELFTKKRLPKGTCPILNGQWKAVMLNEGIFLREFMNEMTQFSLQSSKDGLQDIIKEIFPRTFYYDDQMVVMENLVKRGFVTLSSPDDQDFHHAKLVLKNMAKLHAVSHLMIEGEGHEKFLTRYPNFECALLNPQLMQFFSKAFESALDYSLDVLKKSKHAEGDKTYEYLQKWKGNLAQRLVEVIKGQSPLICVCHGNLCGDNILFQEDNGGRKVEKLVFVDFQMSRIGSPTADIGYYIFRSVNRKARQRWKELLNIYFEELKEYTNYLGQPLNLQFQDLVSDFILKAEMGFLFGIFFSRKLEPNANNSVEETSERIVALVKDYQSLLTN